MPGNPLTLLALTAHPWAAILTSASQTGKDEKTSLSSDTRKGCSHAAMKIAKLLKTARDVYDAWKTAKLLKTGRDVYDAMQGMCDDALEKTVRRSASQPCATQSNASAGR